MCDKLTLSTMNPSHKENVFENVPDVDRVICGDCVSVLKSLPDDTFDLIFTSPPYADNRNSTYKGIPTKHYVEWFLPISYELKRVLKPEGSFVLNIKERTANGERQTYVLEPK